ncbi:hypothetical protein BKH43_04785 [Helicobacter sp. 13S00401-1]|uniref:queuosine precursor transporter n=1 Tax=Helicobacter sp. 13S00401-1 TaxID=1905758 RepID=UPI000BA78965|nr:queuosine precursor transporter [Helicobacter sp. 13S00401-1]PAF50411.1 hypothetical protein BKH43_04785 [Helicobacter sp. 13S00401-1]
MSYTPHNDKMPFKTLVWTTLFFTIIITASNVLVAFQIGHTPLTYGAITYPFSFLLMDVMSEKYDRRSVMKALRVGLVLAFIPSMFISETPRFAIASISAFCVSQYLDVVIFFKIKQRFPKLWWFRNATSASLAQFIDTIIFFHVAFLFSVHYSEVWLMGLSDYSIKLILNFINIPLFYLIAVRTYKRFSFIKR